MGRALRLHRRQLAAALLCAAPWPAAAQASGGVTMPAFTVAVTLSPRAAESLAAASEGITVVAFYTGEATRAARRQANQMGQISLATRRVAIPGRPGTASFPAIPVSAAKLNNVQGRRLDLLVNVYSSRLSNADNLLDCGIFQDTVQAAAASSPLQIACKLIEEM